MRYLFVAAVLGGVGLFTACSTDSEPAHPENPTTPEIPEGPLPITLSFTHASTEKLNEGGFEKGDAIGVYTEYRNGADKPELKPSGNYTDNIRMEYDGTLSWKSDKTIYWQDHTSCASFYAYYPYSELITDATAVPVQVKADQSAKDDFLSHHFSYGKKENVSPTQETVTLTTNWVFSQIEIEVKAGNGFTEEELEQAQIMVRINAPHTQGTLNLASGEVSPAGYATEQTPYLEDKIYKLWVLPQTIKDQEFIVVYIDGKRYSQQKSLTLQSGKKYAFTVTVQKKEEGINVGINPWEDDGTDNGGVAE